jgi:hypothetical protein
MERSNEEGIEIGGASVDKTARRSPILQFFPAQASCQSQNQKSEVKSQWSEVSDGSLTTDF